METETSPSDRSAPTYERFLHGDFIPLRELGDSFRRENRSFRHFQDLETRRRFTRRYIFSRIRWIQNLPRESELSFPWRRRRVSRCVSCLYRPGMDVTNAKLVKMTNWRRQEKIETVGEWKAKAYEIENVSFSLKSRKVTEQSLPTDEDHQTLSEPLRRPRRQHSCFVVEEPKPQSSRRRKSISLPEAAIPVVSSVPRIKEKKLVKSLSPSVWLTDHFPLKTEELLPLLDILANHVKAVRRIRELLTAKFPTGTFPVKLSIPVIPTVKLVMTFSKFVPLPPMDQFQTPLSSPRHLSAAVEDQKDVEDSDQKSERNVSTPPPSLSTPS